MGFTGILLILSGLTVAWAAEATARGRVGVNGLVGIRVGYVTASPEAWLAGHRAARGLTHAAAGVFVAMGILALVFGGTEGALAVVVIGGSLGVLALILKAASQATQAAERVVAENRPDGPAAKHA